MAEDHLDKEISVGASLTESGVEAKANSRTLAALDRLGGNLVEFGNVYLEKGLSRKRATIEGEKQIIAAVAAKAVEVIGSDNAFAARAIAAHFGEAARKQLNKDGVLEKALEDLRHAPPSPEDAGTGPDTLADEFVTRIEHYSSEATTEELRERWGRVLAAEIRRPGTFSRGVLRAIDELDADAARIFEQVCQNRIRRSLPKTLTGELSFNTVAKLVEAGLLLDPGTGHTLSFSEKSDSEGKKVWFLNLGNFGVSFDADKSLVLIGSDPIGVDGNVPYIKVYVLTEVGHAVSSILPDHSDAAAKRLIASIVKFYPDVSVYFQNKATNTYRYLDPSSFVDAQ